MLKLLDHLAREIKGGSSGEAVPGYHSHEAGGAGPHAGDNTATIAGPSSQPAPKRCKVSTRARKVAQNTWHAHPSKMNNREPSSRKKPKRHPFLGMVRKSWIKENDPDHLIRLRDNYNWWNEFEDKIQDGDISDYDVDYLEELDEDSD